MGETRERLLLHCCCGPCSTASVERLLEAGYDVTLFFGNSNIWPESETERRFEALKKVADTYSLPLIRSVADHACWLQAVKGLEGEREGGKRCEACFRYNLTEARQVAQKAGIGLYTTTLTISPLKKSPLIFAVGNELEGFVAIDFKKRGGYLRSIQLSRQLDLYRQDYCGCEFSKRHSSE